MSSTDRPNASDSRALASFALADCRRPALRRRAFASFESQTGLSAEARSSGASADGSRCVARLSIDHYASGNQSGSIHHFTLAQRFDCGGEIPAAVCRAIRLNFAEAVLMFPCEIRSINPHESAGPRKIPLL